MKTTKSIITVLFVLLTAQIASAYYCPSTGRWLSRDPMGELGFETLCAASAVPRVGHVVSPASLPPGRWINRDAIGGKGAFNRYVFCANDPLQNIDLRGLYGNPVSGPNGPVAACPFCLCTLAKYGSPAQQSSGSVINPNTVSLHVSVPYTISVVGDPKACKCRYKDSGSISYAYSRPGGQTGSGARIFDQPGDTHDIPCASGTDIPGLILNAAPGSITYALNFNWTGTLTCESSWPNFFSLADTTSLNGSYNGSFTW